MTSRRRTVVTVWTLFAFVLFAILALLGAFAPPLDVLTTLSAVFVVVPIVLLLVSQVWRATIVVPVALAVASVAIGLWLMGPDLSAAWRQASAAPFAGREQGLLKVVTLNVWDEGVDREQEVAFLRSVNADVIILEEAREDFITRLSVLADLYPTRVTCSEYPYCGVVILAKAPGRLLQGGAWLDALRLSQPYPAFTWRYAAVELSMSTPDGVIFAPIHAVHVKRGELVGPSARQLPNLAERLQRSSNTDRSIVAGDFNTTPWSHAMRAFDARVDVHRITHMLPTWPTPSKYGKMVPPFIAIDHIFVGEEWRVVRLERGPDVGSDHYPLIAWLAPVRRH